MPALARLLVLLLAVGAASASAQDGPADGVLDEANRLGRMLLAYDQAAWHGSDALAPMLEQDQNTLVGRVTGYVVEEAPGGWRVAFGRVAPDSASFLMAYETRLDSAYAVVTTKRHAPSVVVKGFLRDAMIARSLALEQFEPTVDHAHNTVALPAPGGAVYAYVLPSQPATNVYIVGGDGRFTYDPATRTMTDAVRLHAAFDVHDLREDPSRFTVSRVAAGVGPVETDVFYALSRPAVAEGQGQANHYIIADEWIYFLDHRVGIGLDMAWEAFRRVQEQIHGGDATDQ